MKERETNKTNVTVLVKLNYQMVIHTKAIIKMEKEMAKEHTSLFFKLVKFCKQFLCS